MSFVDALVAAALIPVALWILLSGIDDLVVDAVWLLGRRPSRPSPSEALRTEPLTAIFVPLWQEDAVVRSMVEHNTAAIAYSRYHFFLGAYPNDTRTLTETRALEAQRPHVHLALCPHDGPTSKADCLNWIWQHLLLYEAAHGEKFETILIHDAEDLIHPDAVRAINSALARHDMVQVPVLALPTPWTDWTHGVYCDEFAEYQTRDMAVRQAMGAFVPSCGVGTGYRRSAIEQLAEANTNRIFEPASLTEDYENGLRLRLLGARQAVLPVVSGTRGFVATREFFPRTFRTAVRQRTRWQTGIVLQTWERHGWRGSMADRYWLWRDRKGLPGSLVTALANVLGGYVLLRADVLAHATWMADVLPATVVLLVWRLSIRAWTGARVYGWRWALALPLRALLGNVINAAAAAAALHSYCRARLAGEPLRWVKTAHEYPRREALEQHRRTLEEVLAGAAYVDAETLERARDRKPAGVDLGEYLVDSGLLDEEELLEALCLRENLPAARVEAEAVPPQVRRALPARVTRDWRVLPFRIDAGELHVAASRPPTREAQQSLRSFTSLAVRYHLVTRSEFRALERALLR